MAELDRQRGERIRDLREAHAWTQRQLADRLGVDPKTVHNWEVGKELNPTNLREAAELLGVTPDFLRYGEREQPDLTAMLSADGAGDAVNEKLDRILAELAAIRIQLAGLRARPPAKRTQQPQRSRKRAAGS